ncbi:MAG: hypothetical protein NXI04_25780 [Planctomycetaceae bacterium]|nr:hypothetical protein [Planctomycetaceae bacterium]
MSERLPQSVSQVSTSPGAPGRSIRRIRPGFAYQTARATFGLMALTLTAIGCAPVETSFDTMEPERQFDFWLGDWSVRNAHRIAGDAWEYREDATVSVRSILGGRAIVEQWTEQEDGSLRGFSLRTWDEQEKRWEIILNWHSGTPSGFSMMVGTFDGSDGKFFPPKPPSLVRFRFADATANSCRWEQALSDDGQKWLTNWVMEFSRTGPVGSYDAKTLPIATFPETGKFPGARQLDHLVGTWSGEAQRTLSDGSTETGQAQRRVTPVVDGLALLSLTSFSWGEESVSVYTFDPSTGFWAVVGMHSSEPDCHWLVGALTDGRLDLVETPDSNNGVGETLFDLTADSHAVTTTFARATQPQQTQRIEMSLRRSSDEGRVDSIPEFVPSDQMLLARAQAAIAASRFEQAESLLQSLVENGGNSSRLYFQLGYVQQVQEKYDSATASYALALAASRPLVVPVEYNLACMAAVLGDTEEAFEHLDRAAAAGFQNAAQLKADPDFNSIRSDPRFAKFAAGTAADDFVEPTRVIHEILGENPGDQFGWTARVVGDWDKDGVLDFVATAPTFQGKGRVYVYSGRTGDLLLQKTGTQGEQFGNNATGGGDLDQDGHVDLLVGAPNKLAPGNAYAFSGATGELLHHWTGDAAGDLFGNEVLSVSDRDGDGHPDVFVGAAAGSGRQAGAGYGVIYSGKTGDVLLRVEGEQTGDQFGNAAGFMTNDDGTATLAVGAQNAGANDRGRVYVYRLNGANILPAFVIEGDDKSRNLGQMFVTSPGDNDDDGFADIYVSDFGDNTTVRGGGKVRIVSGKDGTDLLTLTGRHIGEGLGTSPSDAGDVNGDGAGDLVIGAWQNAEGAKSGGRVYLYDGRTGDLLRTWTCKTAGDTFGFDACGIGDVDGDGQTDFLLTSAWHNNKQGRVFVLAGGPLEEPSEQDDDGDQSDDE